MMRAIVKCILLLIRYIVGIILDEYVFCPLEARINRLLGIGEGVRGEEGGESATEGYDGGIGSLGGMEASGQE